MNEGVWMDSLRSQSQCEKRDGVWYCKCGSLLCDDAIMCAACRETSRKTHEHAERERRRKEWIEAQNRPIQRAKSQLPNWPHTKTREAFEATISAPILRKIAEQYTVDKGSAVVLGNSGYGKTSLLLRIAERILDDALNDVLTNPRDQEASNRMHNLSRLVWTTGCSLVRSLTEHRFGSRDEPELFKSAAEAPLLLLDELGPESPTRGGEIFDLIDRRYTKGKPTLVTSGLTLDRFKDRYGDAFYRRLTESGRGFLIDEHKRRADG